MTPLTCCHWRRGARKWLIAQFLLFATVWTVWWFMFIVFVPLAKKKPVNYRISERFRQFCFFTKRSTLVLEKSRKINFLHSFFRTKFKIVTFFVNASRLGEKLKKVPFSKKKGGYFELSSENILTSILLAFYPFLTLPNKTLKREKGTFFAVTSDLLKSAKKVPFCS